MSKRILGKVKRKVVRLAERVKSPDPNRVHFLHIGKTGGTAIREALKDTAAAGRYELVLHHHGTRLTDVRKGEKIVFFLRDPISRFTSGFLSRQRKGQPRYYSEWSGAEKKIFAVFATPNDLAAALADSQSREHAIALCAMEHVQHLAHYNKWLDSIAYLEARANDLFHIGFQESLDRDFEALKAKLGLGSDISLPTDDVAAHRNPSGLDRAIDEKAMAGLRRWYEEDFQFVAACQRLSPHLHGR